MSCCSAFIWLPNSWIKLSSLFLSSNCSQALLTLIPEIQLPSKKPQHISHRLVIISEHIVASDQRVLPKVVRFPVAPMNALTMLTGKPTQICLSWLFFNKSPAVLKPRKSDYDFKSQVRGKYFVHVLSVSWGSPP